MAKEKTIALTGPNMINLTCQNLINNLKVGKSSNINIGDIYNHAWTVYHETELITVESNENNN